jgi:hypothetical protein
MSITQEGIVLHQFIRAPWTHDHYLNLSLNAAKLLGTYNSFKLPSNRNLGINIVTSYILF